MRIKSDFHDKNSLWAVAVVVLSDGKIKNNFKDFSQGIVWCMYSMHSFVHEIYLKLQRSMVP